MDAEGLTTDLIRLPEYPVTMGILGDERYQVILALGAFAIPGVVLAVLPLFSIPEPLLMPLPAFVLVGPAIYWWLTATDDPVNERTTAEELDLPPGSTVQEQLGEPPNAALVAANYSRLSEEAQYRDDMLIKANYFSLAILAVLVGVFLQIDPVLRPFVALTGTATAYSFWLATESYKGTRDSLNDRMRIMETVYEELTVVSDYDGRRRSPVGRRSLSSYFVGFQATVTITWILMYFGFVFEVVYL